MVDVLWSSWQVRHIERRHGVTAHQFEEAWEDPAREDLAELDDADWGRYFRSIGSTFEGHMIEMVWRWQHQVEGDAVWPITAWFRDPARHVRRRRAPRRRRRP